MTPAERRQKIEAAARVWWHSEDGDYHFQSLVDLISRLVDEAVAERDKAACGGCGGPHTFDTSVPSVVWNAVVRARGLSEYLCASCVVKAFVQAGVSFTAQLWGDDLPHGAAIEVRVGGQVATDAVKISEENTALRVRLADAVAEERQALREWVRLVYFESSDAEFQDAGAAFLAALDAREGK